MASGSPAADAALRLKRQLQVSCRCRRVRAFRSTAAGVLELAGSPQGLVDWLEARAQLKLGRGCELEEQRRLLEMAWRAMPSLLQLRRAPARQAPTRPRAEVLAERLELEEQRRRGPQLRQQPGLGFGATAPLRVSSTSSAPTAAAAAAPTARGAISPGAALSQGGPGPAPSTEVVRRRTSTTSSRGSCNPRRHTTPTENTPVSRRKT